MSERFGPKFNAYARTGLITILTMLVGTSVPAGLLLAESSTVPPTGKTIATKRTKDLVITITGADSRLKGGENGFCVVFQKRGTEEPIDAQNVSVDFNLLVGRIQEEPLRAKITQEAAGRYCGYVNLGKQYYSLSSYYAFVRYIDSTHKKKRKVRFLLTVK